MSTPPYRCVHGICQAPIERHYRFCPRCGTSTIDLFQPLTPEMRLVRQKELMRQTMLNQMMQMPSDHQAMLRQQLGMRNQLTELAGLGQDQNLFNYLGLGGLGLL